MYHDIYSLFERNMHIYFLYVHYTYIQSTLNNMGVGTSTPPPHKLQLKSAYNFWLPRNLTPNSLLLTGSLTNNINSWLTHILYVICISIFVLCIHYIPNFFLIFSVFLGYMVCLQCFSEYRKSPKIFSVHFLKKIGM